MERYCSNCREELPPKAASCPACGVYAGDVFDGQMPGRGRKVFRSVVLIALLLGAAAAWYALRDRDLTPLLPQRQSQTKSEKKVAPFVPAGPVRSDAEAVKAVRRYLVSTGVEKECVALIVDERKRNAWVLLGVNRCEKLRLGRFRVDARTGEVTRGNDRRPPAAGPRARTRWLA